MPKAPTEHKAPRPSPNPATPQPYRVAIPSERVVQGGQNCDES